MTPRRGAFDLDCSALAEHARSGRRRDLHCDLHRYAGRPRRRHGHSTRPTHRRSFPTTARRISDGQRLVQRRQSASLSLVKAVDVGTYDAVGDVLTYAITVTNHGNVTLDDVDVSDPNPGSGLFTLDCAQLPASLGPGGEGTCEAEYTVTQADLDAGTITNVASAEASSPAGSVQVADAQATSTAQQSPAMTVTKAVDATDYDAPGDLLTYTVTVTNTGNVTVASVGVTDASPGAGDFDLDCGSLPATLAPGDEGPARQHTRSPKPTSTWDRSPIPPWAVANHRVD